ncbi:hypothetical protein QTV49_003884 [Vibrio vulnificus]|nr:hypothetical protein [Vibrio vulnificus]
MSQHPQSIDNNLDEKLANAHMFDLELALYTDKNSIENNLSIIERDIPKNTKSELTDLEVSLNHLINDQDEILDTAIKARTSVKWRQKLRTAPKFLGKVGQYMLTASLVAIPVISDFAPEAIEAGKGSFEAIKNIATGESVVQLYKFITDYRATHETITSLITEENIRNVAIFGAWHGFLLEARNAWDKMFERTFGAYSSGQITNMTGQQIDVASIIAAYNRLGIDFYTKDSELRDEEALVADIKNIAKHASSLSQVEIFDLMKATGLISSEQYKDMLKLQVVSDIRTGKYNEHQTDIAITVLPLLDYISNALHATYRYDDRQRRAALVTEKFYDNVVFDKQGYEQVDSFMRSCLARGEGGCQRPTDDNSAINLIKEHILSAILSDDKKEMREIMYVIQLSQKAIESLGVKSASDAVLANESESPNLIIKASSHKFDLVKSVGVENIAALVHSGRALTSVIDKHTTPKNDAQRRLVV